MSAPNGLCGARNGEWTCSLAAGHDGPHEDRHPSGGCVGWAPTPSAPTEPQAWRAHAHEAESARWFLVNRTSPDVHDRRAARALDCAAAALRAAAETVGTLRRDVEHWRARALAAEAQTVRAADGPEADGTDCAHPAWWRGERAGSSGVLRALVRVLDDAEAGKVRAGTFGDDGMEAFARRLTDLRARVAAGEQAVEALREIDRLTPATCDMTSAHEMGQIAADALAALPPSAAPAAPTGDA